MLFNTFPFLLFFITVFTIYWNVPKKFQWIVLLLGSYFFYGSWKPAYLGIILITTLINYFIALAIHRSKQHKKQYLILALLINLGTLFLFKYFNFFTISLDQLFQNIGWNIALPQWKLLLPLGISFYTFQVIGYIVDVYRGNITPEKHLGFFALFVCFFPQVVSGPIERGKELLPQLKMAHTFAYPQIVSGLKLFTFGLFKKMVIADNIAVIVDHTFNSLPQYKGISLIITMFLFAWQIYMDFSGYTDMARGIARMLGFHLIENFNMPYLATSVRDFWKRWHISLSRFLKDYLYIPLGGNRNGLWRTCLNIFIVFTLCGLWHGAAWNFVVWGAFHGLVMVGERLVGKITKFQIPNTMKITYTFCMVNISWIFFRSQTLTDAVYILRYAFVGFKNFFLPSYIWASISQLFTTNKIEMGITAGLLATAIILEIIPKTTITAFVHKQPAAIRYSLYILSILMIIHLRNANIKEFIYVRF